MYVFVLQELILIQILCSSFTSMAHSIPPRRCCRAHEALSSPTSYPRSRTNHNVPISKGVPALVCGYISLHYLHNICIKKVQNFALPVRTVRTIPHCLELRLAHSCSLGGKRANTEVDFREPKALRCSAPIFNAREVPNESIAV
jgi:hypothetical protein